MKACISVLLHNTFVCRVEDLSMALLAGHEFQRRESCILALTREKRFQLSCTSVRPSTQNSVITTSVRATHRSILPYWTHQPCLDMLHLISCLLCKNKEVLHVLPAEGWWCPIVYTVLGSISQKWFANTTYVHIANDDSTAFHQVMLLVSCTYIWVLQGSCMPNVRVRSMVCVLIVRKSKCCKCGEKGPCFSPSSWYFAALSVREPKILLCVCVFNSRVLSLWRETVPLSCALPPTV